MLGKNYTYVNAFIKVWNTLNYSELIFWTQNKSDIQWKENLKQHCNLIKSLKPCPESRLCIV